MKIPIVMVALALGVLSLTGCDSVTVVERHHERRPSGYYGGSRYYGNRYDSRYDGRYDNRYSSNRYDSGYYGRRSNTVVVASQPNYHRSSGVYATSTRSRNAYVAARPSGTTVVVKGKKQHHHDHDRD